MKRFWIVLLVSLIAVLAGCSVKIHDSGVEQEEASGNISEKLVVYMNASPHIFRSFDEEENVLDTTIYPSRYVIGTMLSAGDVESPNANIFEKALKEYETEKKIEIEVHYLEEAYAYGQYDILQHLVDNDETLPDLLILNKQPLYDYYRLAEQGYLLDFSDYFAKDEFIKDDELYYQKVLEGGEITGKQVAVPLLFTMNAMMTSSSFMEKIGCAIPKDDASYEELLFVLEESCAELANDKKIAAIHETGGNMPLGHYIPSILTAAAYPNYFDMSSGDILVSAKAISDILELMTYYNRQEFAPIIGWENNSYIENMHDGNSKSIQIPKSIGAIDYMGVFLSGGRAGGVGFYNSLLTDAAFMQSVYEEAGEKLVLCGIPTLESSQRYSANISMAAYGMATTEYPEEVYGLIRYLMDYEFPYQYGFSVNKGITNRQIENAQKTAISVYPEDIWEGVNSVMSQEDLNNQIFHLDFLSKENAEIIENMLDNIAGAGLPYAVLEYNMYNSMLNMVGDNKMTPDEAGEWVLTQWNQYLDQLNEWEPFFDANFNNSIQLYGDLPEE